MEGNLVVPKTRGIGEILNGKRPFLEFESSNGDKIYISKPSIQTVQMLDYPRPMAARRPSPSASLPPAT
jgi:hypothetical protein